MSSIRNYVKNSITYCRISNCKWSGHIRNMVEHFEKFHPRQIRKIKQKSYFQLNFDDLRRKNPLLLSTDKGLYWFIQNDKKQQDGYFSRGIFAIGKSTTVEYYIKLGMFSTKNVQLLGPFQSQEEKTQRYDFVMHANYMEYLTSVMTPNVILFFGEFDDDADESIPREISSNLKSSENFVCSACDKLVAGALLFCKSHHFLCEKCFEIVLTSECPKCEMITNAFPPLGKANQVTKYCNAVDVGCTLRL